MDCAERLKSGGPHLIGFRGVDVKVSMPAGSHTPHVDALVLLNSRLQTVLKRCQVLELFIRGHPVRPWLLEGDSHLEQLSRRDGVDAVVDAVVKEDGCSMLAHLARKEYPLVAHRMRGGCIGQTID